MHEPRMQFLGTLVAHSKYGADALHCVPPCIDVIGVESRKQRAPIPKIDKRIAVIANESMRCLKHTLDLIWAGF